MRPRPNKGATESEYRDVECCLIESWRQEWWRHASAPASLPARLGHLFRWSGGGVRDLLDGTSSTTARETVSKARFDEPVVSDSGAPARTLTLSFEAAVTQIESIIQRIEQGE